MKLYSREQLAEMRGLCVVHGLAQESREVVQEERDVEPLIPMGRQFLRNLETKQSDTYMSHRQKCKLMV